MTPSGPISSRLPQGEWMLHTTQALGGITDRWIDLQVTSGERFEARLLGLDHPADVERQPHWLVAADRRDLWLAWKGIWRSRGLTSRWLARELRSPAPQLIHAHYGPYAACQLPLVGALGVPLVASFYGFDATQRRFTDERRWRRAYARLFDAVGAVLAEGPHMASRVERLGCPAEKLRVVRLPADEASLADVERRTGEGFLAVLAGRFEEKKGFDLGIRAFARALQGRPGARLLMVGGGEQESRYRRIAAEEGIAEQVEWAGRLPFREFMGRIGEADLALYPSRTASDGDSEGGAPVTLIEAQWLGVPSIVSSHDDLPFAAAPDGSVVLQPTDLEGWSEAIAALSENAAERERMGAAARRFARENHSVRANVLAREAIYASQR